MILPVVMLVSAGALFGLAIARNSVLSSGPPDPEAGLTDEQRQSLHATAIAESATLVKQQAVEYAKSGEPLDSLPQTELLVQTSVTRQTPEEAAVAADLVAKVSATNLYVDEGTGRMKLKVQVIALIKGTAPADFDIELAGGPRRSPSGWVLAVAPGEMVLQPGSRAIVFLSKDRATASYRERPMQTLALDGLDRVIADADHRSMWMNLAGRPGDVLLGSIAAAVQAQ